MQLERCRAVLLLLAPAAATGGSERCLLLPADHLRPHASSALIRRPLLNLTIHTTQIAEWVSFAHTALSPLMDAQLAELNTALVSRTFVAATSRPSLADLVLYAAVAPAAAAFPVAQHGHFCNLLRWYDLLHHTADAQRLFPAPTPFARPRYAAPLPPPPAEPKASKGAADKAAAGAAAGAAQPAQAASSGDGKKGGGKQAAVAAAAPAEGADAPAGGKADKKVCVCCACCRLVCFAGRSSPGPTIGPAAAIAAARSSSSSSDSGSGSSSRDCCYPSSISVLFHRPPATCPCPPTHPRPPLPAGQEG
jgi:hypothetical protein